MVFSLEHDIKVTKNHQNLLPTQSVLVAHTVFNATNAQNGHRFRFLGKLQIDSNILLTVFNTVRF
jgi:hypothetical protein